MIIRGQKNVVIAVLTHFRWFFLAFSPSYYRPSGNPIQTMWAWMLFTISPRGDTEHIFLFCIWNKEFFKKRQSFSLMYMFVERGVK